MKDEAERLAARLPEGAHVVLLDARGKGMTSARISPRCWEACAMSAPRIWRL